MKIYQKLNQARAKFHTLKLKKTGLNKFAGYQYFELSDFLIPALETFSEYGICAYISFGTDVATMSLVDIEDGSKIELTSPMAEAQLKGCHPIQNLGAVETYTRRYLWVAALEIVEHDALDSTQPLSTKGDIRGTAVKQAAMSGIGDHLSPEWKDYLEQTAKLCDKLVDDGDVEGAVSEKYREPMDDEAMELYMESKMKSTTKSAMRKHNK